MPIWKASFNFLINFVKLVLFDRKNKLRNSQSDAFTASSSTKLGWYLATFARKWPGWILAKLSLRIWDPKSLDPNNVSWSQEWISKKGIYKHIFGYRINYIPKPHVVGCGCSNCHSRHKEDGLSWDWTPHLALHILNYKKWNNPLKGCPDLD